MNPNDLLTAATKQALSAIASCITQGIDINYQSPVKKVSALMLLARLGNTELINFLMAMGADPTLCDKYGDNAITMAMNLGVPGISTVKALLWDIEADSPFAKGSKEAFDFQRLANEVLSRYIVLHDDESAIQLIEQLPDINFLETSHLSSWDSGGGDFEATPLLTAAREGRIAVLQALIESGQRTGTDPFAGVNAGRQGRQLDWCTYRGMTPLHMAAMSNQLETLALLCPYMNVDIEDEAGNSPFMYAAGHGHLEAAQYLKAQGANPRKTAKEHTANALHLATQGWGSRIIVYKMDEEPDFRPKYGHHGRSGGGVPFEANIAFAAHPEAAFNEEQYSKQSPYPLNHISDEGSLNANADLITWLVQECGLNINEPLSSDRSYCTPLVLMLSQYLEVRPYAAPEKINGWKNLLRITHELGGLWPDILPKEGALWGAYHAIMIAPALDPAVVERGNQFLLAAANHDADTVEGLLTDGVDPNTQSEAKILTALHIATQQGNLFLVRRLLASYETDPFIQNVFGEDAPTIAVNQGHENFEMIDLFAKLPGFFERASFEFKRGLHNIYAAALAVGDQATLAKMEREYAAYIQWNPIASSSWAGSEIVEPPLFSAVLSNDEAPIERCIQNGSEVNYLGNSHWCFNIMTHIARSMGQYQYTPLHLAAILGHINAARALIRHGADIDALDSTGKTPFLHACFAGHLEMAQLLFEAKANPYQKTKEGSTALDLLMHGFDANYNIYREELEQPALNRSDYLQYAKENGGHSLATFLEWTKNIAETASLDDFEELVAQIDSMIFMTSNFGHTMLLTPINVEFELCAPYTDIATVESRFNNREDADAICLSSSWGFYHCHSELMQWLVENFEFDLNPAPREGAMDGRRLPLHEALRNVAWYAEHEYNHSPEMGRWQDICLFLVQKGADLAPLNAKGEKADLLVIVKDLQDDNFKMHLLDAAQQYRNKITGHIDEPLILAAGAENFSAGILFGFEDARSRSPSPVSHPAPALPSPDLTPQEEHKATSPLRNK